MTPALWTIASLGLFAVMAAVVGTSGGVASAAIAHVIGAKGWVEADPRDLARKAGVSSDVYALASMMVSEAGTSSTALMAAVGWCAVNMADQQNISLLRLLTRAGRNDGEGKFQPHASDGFFGPQNIGPRYAATRKAPTKSALDLADQVISGEIDDLTGGCTRFDAPKVQDALVAAGTKGYEKSAADIAAERSKGAEMVWLPGITSTRFWRPKT
jgi:hypothetical protein